MNLDNRQPTAETDIADQCLECGIDLDTADAIDFKGDSLCYDCAEDRLLENEFVNDPSSPEWDPPRRGSGSHRH